MMRIFILTTALLLTTVQFSTFTQEDANTETATEQKDITEPEEITATPQADTAQESKPEESTQEQATPQKSAPAPEPVALPEIPQPMPDVEKAMPEEPEPNNPIGIDTMSLEDPQGNWLYKRIWWERAEERYEKIRVLVDAIWESRTTFFTKRNDLDKNVLRPFYLSVGVEQGELQIILSELNEFLEKQREQEGDLNEQERELYETLSTEKETLKQLQADTESIANLDRAIDDALGTLMNQINRVRHFEKQAWESFKEISHILSDTKARELYYIVEGAGRNIKNISTYLERDFLTHFTKIVNEATKHVARVQSQIQALKEKGVSFKRQEDILAQQKEKERLEKEEEAAQEEEEVAPKPKLGWFGWIMANINNAFSYIISIIRMPYDMIFGGRR